MADENNVVVTNDAVGRIVTGYSNLYYKLDDGTPAVLSGAVNVTVSVDSADDIKFYTDNALATSATPDFSSGTISMEIDGLSETTAKIVYGLDTPSATWQDYKTTNTAPFLQIGFIVRYQSNQNVYYVPVICPKVQLKPRSTNATTQSENIEFQTETLEGVIYADDSGDWKLEGAQFAIEGTTTTTTDSALKALYDKMNS